MPNWNEEDDKYWDDDGDMDDDDEDDDDEEEEEESEPKPDPEAYWCGFRQDILDGVPIHEAIKKVCPYCYVHDLVDMIEGLCMMFGDDIEFTLNYVREEEEVVEVVHAYVYRQGD